MARIETLLASFYYICNIYFFNRVIRRFYLTLLCVLLIHPGSFAFNLRKVALGNGGSVINSVFQDTRGLIWIAGNNGLYTYDGKETTSLNGYKGIRNIYGTSEGDIFAETVYGLNVINTTTETTTVFEMFNNLSYSTTDSKGSSFIIQGNGFIYYKLPSRKKYDNIIIPNLIAAKIKAFFCRPQWNHENPDRRWTFKKL